MTISSAIAYLILVSGLAATIALLSLFLRWFDSLESDIPGQPRDKTDSANENQAHRNPIAAAITTYDENRKAHERQNTRHSAATLRIIAVTGIFAAIAAGAASVSSIISYGQLDEMRSDKRPWISVDVIPAGNLIIKEGGIFLEVFFDMKNTGKSPAVFVWPEKNTIPNAIGTRFDEWQKPVNCIREPRPKGERKAIEGFALFPDQTFRFRDTITFERNKMKSTDFNGHPSASPAIVGCVRYKFISDNTWHQTGFAYMIGKYARGSIFSGAVIIPLDEGDINLDSLRLIQSAVDGGRFFNAD
jgi:hypothetical protein